MADILGNKAVDYYSKEESLRYDLSGAFRRIQESMAFDALEIADFSKNFFILDLGCGTGFSMNVLKSEGLKCLGIDISFEMLLHAKNKGFDVFLADMKSLPFKDESFDGLISISAIQWESPEDYNLVLDEIKRVIKDSAVIQFYPKNPYEFDFFLKNAKKKFFEANAFIVGSGVKAKKYIKLKK